MLLTTATTLTLAEANDPLSWLKVNGRWLCLWECVARRNLEKGIFRVPCRKWLFTTKHRRNRKFHQPVYVFAFSCKENFRGCATNVRKWDRTDWAGYGNSDRWLPSHHHMHYVCQQVLITTHVFSQDLWNQNRRWAGWGSCLARSGSWRVDEVSFALIVSLYLYHV